jgi:uncharacterized membrane protein
MGKKHHPIQKQNTPQTFPKNIPPTQSGSRQMELRQEIHQGPLPHPDILLKYDQIVPRAAERIICMAENQAKHRQALEKAVIESDIRDSRTGLIFGFIIGLVAIISGAICIISGYSIAGGLLGGSAVPALTGVFVYGSRQRRKERESKQKQTAVKS